MCSTWSSKVLKQLHNSMKFVTYIRRTFLNSPKKKLTCSHVKYLKLILWKFQVWTNNFTLIKFLLKEKSSFPIFKFSHKTSSHHKNLFSQWDKKILHDLSKSSEKVVKAQKKKRLNYIFSLIKFIEQKAIKKLFPSLLA